MTKAILFDFWGTLVEQGVWSPIKQVKNLLEIEMGFSEYVVRMEQALMTKKFESLKEGFENLGKEFGLALEEEMIEELIGLWNKAWMLAEPYEETEEVLKDLRKKYKIILVTNTDCFSVEQVLEKFGLGKLFDEVFLSYKLGVIKTDKLFLRTVLTELNLTPEEYVLVGDSIQSDVMAAKRMGIRAVLVDRRGTRNYEPKIKNLKELDGFLEND